MRWLGRAFTDALRTGDLGIALTGAGSWLGNAFLAMLAAEDALPRRLRLFGSRARTFHFDGREFAVEALADAAPLHDKSWLLLHFAFLGKERTADLATADFIAANDAILAHTLRIAAKASDLRMVFTSSGAVYRPDRTLVCAPEESPYGWCKVEHERRLKVWCAELNVPLVIPRIFNIGGPHANKVSSYALSSFILSAQESSEIVIRAPRPTFRSFVHVNEVLAAACDAALTHSAGTPLAFDTAGDEVIEMQDLAERVAASMPHPVKIRRARCEGAPDAYVGGGANYRTLIAAQGRTITALDAIVADTAFYLRDIQPTMAPAA